MKKYEKTPNLFKRYKEKPHIGRYDVSEPMCKGFDKVDTRAWRYVEKIDGMNMRLIIHRGLENGELKFDVRGRSNRAQIPGDLLDNINTMLDNRREELGALLTEDVAQGITLYGEGYGPGIQKDGGLYREDKGFVLFDIARWSEVPVDLMDQDFNQYYLYRDDVKDLAEMCRLTVAPEVFAGTSLANVVKRVKDGFVSRLAQAKGCSRMAEGIVAQADGLFHHYDGAYRRMKFKLKTKDFPS